ncbi:MAG TPA: hypothetical protein VIN03_04435, partial [Roseateles sp.]
MNEEGLAPAVPVPRRGAMAWLREGGHVLAFLRPRWEGLQASPLAVAVLVLANYLLVLALQRALMAGAPRFLWMGVLSGWVGVAVSAWLCWVAA